MADGAKPPEHYLKVVPLQPQYPGRRALVLGGGGAFGIVEAAYIKAAFEAGYRPDLVIGTSVGALNGAWVATRPDDPDGLIDIWNGLDDFRVIDASLLRLAAGFLRRRNGLCENSLVSKLVETHVGELQFEDTALELAIVATNLTRGRKQVFREGPVGRAIRASTALPGVFAPLVIDGESFVDGGVTAAVDIGTAIEMGASEVLAIELSPPFSPRDSRTALGVIVQSFGLLSHAATDAAEALAAQQAAVRVLRPDLGGLSPWRLARREGMLESFLETARHDVAVSLDGAGHVIGGATHRPRAIIEPRPRRTPLRLLPRGGTRNSAA
jgi:NTE family protein